MQQCMLMQVLPTLTAWSLQHLRQQFHEVRDEIQADVLNLQEELESLKRQDRKEFRVQAALAYHDAALKGVRAFIDGPSLETQDQREKQKTTLQEEVDLASNKTAFPDFPRSSRIT